MRTVIVGGSRTGKSTLAREMRRRGVPTFCGDPIEFVKEPEADVTYLPSGLAYSGDDGGAAWIAEHWFTMPGPFCIEGHVTARALKRWLNAPEQYGSAPDHFPCDRIVVFLQQRPELELLKGQISQHKGVMTTWRSIADYFEGMTETRSWSDE
jgi:hypothetical protein